MTSPGFEIYNDTIWPMQISLSQAGPLYYDLVPPKSYFRRRTGAVWFTITSTISLDNQLHITTLHAIIPIMNILNFMILGTAFGLAGATAAARGLIPTQLAAVLQAGGPAAQNALMINGAVLGELDDREARRALAGVFNERASTVSRRGSYAGRAWPFRHRVHTFRITGGPYFKDAGNGRAELVSAPLYID
jgi:hypothetical protein